MRWIGLLLLAAAASAQAELIDRIAVVVDKSIVKDSDIDRDIRVTQFLNREQLHFTSTERKASAAKLIEQIFLREEIRTGGYQNATPERARSQMDALVKERFHNEAELRGALTEYGLDDKQLLDQLRWQLTVLDFINARFRPAVAGVNDSQIEEEVNRLFFAWLDEKRKAAKIAFHEDGLA